MSSANEHMLPPPQKHKLSPLELRNTDLVSRLLAATPPYLYNMSLLPNTYFFSEMLRSFVQAKNEQSLQRNAMNFQPPLRRSRKRAWPACVRETAPTVAAAAATDGKRMDNPEPWMIKSNRKNEENPLELTHKMEEEAKPKTEGLEEHHQQQFVGAQEHSPNLVLPPPPPMWYPPLYPNPPQNNNHQPPKEGGENSDTGPSTSVGPTNNQEMREDVKSEDSKDLFKQTRQCSAFTVPVPGKTKQPKKFDVKSMGLDKARNKAGTNYIMGNIASIYKSLGTSKGTADNDAEKKVKDLRTLIGLELVVDYMSHKKPIDDVSNQESNDETLSSDIESVGSPTLEVVALQ
ncbi:uncharacterized protein LOC132702251 isoform X2 [Cylas formicarius]|uniref:uncharacterized protein LOC132702251 isoform X2 n=1 Tax=Cylas formicarius TaxID=197179 RepID=UPI00295832C5|nr:uncharacterized protein LOC132702251 isoform X2 [Cylas formicarius]